MKFNTSIPESINPYYKAELGKYRTEYLIGNLKSTRNHLERAHIIGQKYPYAHTHEHWQMLQFRIKSRKEITGQI